jgi:hypothetical protein
MTAEAFFANSVPFDVYDFQVDPSMSNFSLTITASSPFFNGDYGVLLCANPQTQGTQCFSGSETGLFGTPATTPASPTNSVTFNVSGNGQGLVVYVQEPESTGPTQNPNVHFAGPPQPTVTATITSNTPEPGTLPILAVALIGLAALKRRSLAKLL